MARIEGRLKAAAVLMCSLAQLSPASIVGDVTYIFGKGHNTPTTIVFSESKYMPYKFEFDDGDGTVPEYSAADSLSPGQGITRKVVVGQFGEHVRILGSKEVRGTFERWFEDWPSEHLGTKQERANADMPIVKVARKPPPRKGVFDEVLPIPANPVRWSEVGVQRVIEFNSVALARNRLSPGVFLQRAAQLESSYKKVSVLIIGASLLPKDSGEQLATLVDAADLSLKVQEPRSAIAILSHVMAVLNIVERPADLAEQVAASRRALRAREEEKMAAKKIAPPRVVAIKSVAIKPARGNTWAKRCDTGSLIAKDKDGTEHKKVLSICQTITDITEARGVLTTSVRLDQIKVDGVEKQVLRIIVPLGAVLPAGASVTFFPKDLWAKLEKREELEKGDEAKLKSLNVPYLFCDAAGCHIEAGADADLMSSLKGSAGFVITGAHMPKGSAGSVITSAHMAEAQPVDYRISLSGFNEARDGPGADPKLLLSGDRVVFSGLTMGDEVVFLGLATTGEEIVVPDLGRIGRLRRVDFGLELLYSGNADKTAPESDVVRGNIKRF